MNIFTIPNTTIDKKLKLSSQELIDSEGQVIVHCVCHLNTYSEAIRIWKTTYLLDRNSDHRSKLLYADGISLFPIWTNVKFKKNARFSLIFSRLPKSCLLFDLVEDIPESNGFKVNSINRNNTDVYQVDFYA